MKEDINVDFEKIQKAVTEILDIYLDFKKAERLYILRQINTAERIMSMLEEEL